MQINVGCMTLGAVVLLFVERCVFVGKQAREKLLLRGSSQYIVSVVWVRMMVVRNSIYKSSVSSKYSLPPSRSYGKWRIADHMADAAAVLILLAFMEPSTPLMKLVSDLEFCQLAW